MTLGVGALAAGALALIGIGIANLAIWALFTYYAAVEGML